MKTDLFSTWGRQSRLPSSMLAKTVSVGLGTGNVALRDLAPKTGVNANWAISRFLFYQSYMNILTLVGKFNALTKREIHGSRAALRCIYSGG